MAEAHNCVMMTRGETVLVRTYGGLPRIRRLWDATARGCVVAEEAGFQRLLAGDLSAGVGVPAEDVFEYRPEVALSLDPDQPFTAWDTLPRYNAEKA